ncbi:Os11g0249700 [Oryza sativa Japonica Group]|uniref:Os11g0249700 protein n=1 Tax=Oryza sativa subsp. japonica TaxID=39947 RepID=A0A0P0Y0T9_ORYSJ|nr:hypothetical protein EE612_054499 [Oryza sativa]BAT13439.1 Os11g0249700 [Oryza sativa Japonica Group]
MGFWTSRMATLANRTPETRPAKGFPHVLIRRPFCVPASDADSTVTFRTSPSPARPPRLPMLIPCPGPHRMLRMATPEVPGPTETQSSPVRTVALRTATSRDSATWMPSVLGLSAGAAIRTPWSVTPAQSKMETCTFLLSTSVTRFTDTLFDWLIN